MPISLARRTAFVIVLPVIAAIVIVVSLWNRPWDFVRILGLLLLVPNFILLTTARLNLGNAFSVSPQAKKLVTTGLYSRVRNPIYVSVRSALPDSSSIWIKQSTYRVSCP